MTLRKPVIGLVTALALTACDATAPLPQGQGAAAAPVASRAARASDTLTEADVVRAVMSSL